MLDFVRFMLQIFVDNYVFIAVLLLLIFIIAPVIFKRFMKRHENKLSEKSTLFFYIIFLIMELTASLFSLVSFTCLIIAMLTLTPQSWINTLPYREANLMRYVYMQNNYHLNIMDFVVLEREYNLSLHNYKSYLNKNKYYQI